MNIELLEREEEIIRFRKSRLSRGAWILMPYGFEDRNFLVIDVTKDNKFVRLALKDWSVSSASWFPVERVLREGRYMGHGNKKWYRKFLVGFRNLILPYSKCKK